MERYQKQLDSLRENANLRQLRDISLHENQIGFQGRDMLNLSSNDYLALGADKTYWKQFLQQEATVEADYFPGSACSSRLLTGNHSAYTQLEHTLATLYGSQAALVFNSGYHANLGILPALSTNKDLILADKLVHASLIDGIRLSSARCVRFPHNDLDRVESILQKERDNYEHVFIVTESIFSMDGDLADLTRLVEIKKRYNAFIYLDEAHAVGVRGDKGLGCAEECGLLSEIDFLVGTFGKAIASQGAWLVCTRLFKDYLVNTMRPLIFSTGLPPWSIRWTHFVMQHLAEMKTGRAHLHAIAQQLRQELQALGLETAGDSHIVPIIVRDSARALQLSNYFCDHGFFALPIRTPTVPAGTERLRLSLTAAISHSHIQEIINLCKLIGK